VAGGEVRKMKNKVKCCVCGRELHKDINSRRLENWVGELWKDEYGEYGLDEPKHWHAPKKGEVKMCQYCNEKCDCDCEYCQNVHWE
jgi:hypothetical protein